MANHQIAVVEAGSEATHRTESAVDQTEAEVPVVWVVEGAQTY